MLMRLFLSYSRKDTESTKELARLLEAGGHYPWFDHKLVPGQRWQDILLEEIHKCSIFVYVLSPDSVQSQYCQWEYREAVRNGKSILPVEIRDITDENNEYLLPESLQDILQIQLLRCTNGFTGEAVALLFNGVSYLEKVTPSTESIQLNPKEFTEIPAQATTVEIDPNVISSSNIQEIAETAILHGHDDTVSRLSFFKEGNSLISKSFDNTIGIWDITNNKLVTMIADHERYTISTKSQMLALARTDGRLWLWNLSTFEPIRTLGIYESRIRSMVFSFDGKYLIVLFRDGKIAVWNMGNYRKEFSTPDDDQIRCFNVSRDMRFLAMGTVNGNIQLWDMQDIDMLDSVQAHDSAVHSLRFSFDSECLLSSSSDGTIKAWTSHDLQQRHEFEKHDKWAHSVKFSKNGDLIASASGDGVTKLWDANSFDLLQNFEEHSDVIHSVSFSPTSDLIVSASNDGTIRFWNKWRNTSQRVLDKHDSGVYSIAFSGDGKCLASGSADKTIRLWSL